MKKLTDEELIELAKLEDANQEYYDNSFDVGYYQESHMILDGNDKVYTEILHHHYKRWSASPISLDLFHDMLKLKRKKSNSVYIDKKICNIDLNKALGAYVKSKKIREKEKRLRQISSIKPKT
jgi:hypothetical protein